MNQIESISLKLCRGLLGKEVQVKIDRPLGSHHPKHGFEYLVNYGFIPGVIAPDGEDLDAYVLGVREPMQEFTGIVVAVVHRLDDDDDKLIVVPARTKILDEDIERQVAFQEQYFRHVIIR